MAGYRYHNGKRFVGGTAALLHKVKEDGGLNNHYNKVIQKAIPGIVDAIIDDENKQDLKKSLKVVKIKKII